MTLNQVISRIEEISLAHNQLRSFFFGAPSDFLTDKRTRFAGCFLQDTPGVIDVAGRQVVFGFRMYLLDMANVAKDARENELEVQSDMTSVAMDLIAEFNSSVYTDWKVSTSNVTSLLREKFDDMVAGVYVDISISVQYPLDICAVPTEVTPLTIISEVEKSVYDMEYVATGAEGSTFVPAAAVGKKILLIIRENAPLHKVSNNPDPAEFTWDDAEVELGTPISVAGERFLILYRNY